MFPTSAFNQIPMGFQYPGQQPPPPPPIYQSQFGGFNPQIQTPFQQAPPSRGQSLPASGRYYPPPSGPYAPPSSRQNGQYPPPVPPQNYEHHNHGSKKHHKQRSVSPNNAADQSLYSDKEKDDRSRSQSPTLESPTKEEEEEAEAHHNHQEPHSQEVENASGEVLQGGTTVNEEQQNSQEKEKRKSRSKKKKHHRHEQYHNQYQQPPPFYGELPTQMRVHQQPLYSGYNQVFEESIRRGDVYHKHVKRSARLPPEVKQQLLPHEDDKQKQNPFSGYPQQPFRPPFNPYQPYASQPGFFPQTTPYNTPQPWTNVGGINHSPAEQEIQRLRSHIHTLEGELHKLQKKLNKASINQTKPDDIRSPRQTPVIVELNNAETNRESSSKKKHRHRNGSSQHGQNSVQPSGENNIDQNTSNQQQTDLRERSRSGGNQISEVDSKPPSKSSREETAAQLAHAAAAHVNARQQVPPPPPVQQQQQQQYSYQQGGFPPQPHQVRGPAPRLPLPVNDPYQQRNFNQSNNNELLDNNEERRNRRSADKILDAFERFYMTKATTTPMKVKYIPEDNNSNHQRNTNNNNNNNYRDRSISQNSSTCN